MKLNSLNLKRLLVGLFFLMLPMACDSGSDSNDGGGTPNEPFVSACDGFIATITGTEGNDNLVGTEGNDIIRGLGGNDTIDGRGGNDRICGDRGNDNLLGGNGIDILDGGPDDDIVDGQSGNDIILEAPGSDDVLVGPAFNPEGVQTLDEVSFTNAVNSISLDLTSGQQQVVDKNGNTIRIDGFFPNIYGSFHPDSFFFSNAAHNGAVGHVFDPRTGGNDFWVIDAANTPIRVIPELSIFDGILGPLQGDRTILIGDTTVLNSVDVEHLAAYNVPPTIIDDGEQGYSSAGFTNQAIGGQGFNGDIDLSPAGEGNTAIWNFSDIPNGSYHVATTWDPAPDRATDAPFSFVDGAGQLTSLINQELAPNDFQDEGASWETLGLININSNKLTVTLTNDADQFVIADAVRIERFYNDADLLVDNDIGFEPGEGSFDPQGFIPIPDDLAFLETQIFIDADGGFSFNTQTVYMSSLSDKMAAKNTNMFLVTVTYAPDTSASTQTVFNFTLNGTTFEKVLDQTTITPSFFDAPSGLTPFQNAFLCRVGEIGSNPIIQQLNGQFVTMQSGRPVIFDAVGITPVNKFEMQFFGLPDTDFDGDQTCAVLN